jgi:hypothetical protein
VKFKHIAIATLLPAAIAGLTISIGAAAAAAPSHHAADHNTRHVAHRSAIEWVAVRPGDTLQKVAAAHDVTWRELYATPPNYQHVQNPDHLTVGERLRIPADPKLRAAQFLSVWRHEAAQARREKADRARAAAHAQAQAQAPAQAQAQAPAQGSAASQPLTAGMSAFEQCVAWRESGDNPTASSAGLFGILPATWQSLGYSGTAGQASVALQKQAFSQLYAQDGTSPWAPYDGC